jgi:ubiquitin carboxyl-terminal hydrolase 36/42
MSRKGQIGLANLGNTCFINAVLQALRHYPEIVHICTHDLLTTACTEQNSPHAPITRAYADIVKCLESGDGAYVVPRGFYDTLCSTVQDTVYADFARRTAQDAHEFLVWLLDQLYMATARPKEIPYSADVEGSKEWADSFRKSYSPLAEFFFGQLVVSYTCSTCKTTHKRYETFNTLKIQPAAGMSWAECIEEEIMTEETIDGYACETCAANGQPRAPALKTQRLVRLPKLLIFTVKRYTPTGARINTPIVHDNSDFRFQAIFSDESKHASRDLWYRTIGVVDHLGYWSGGGHYVAQCLAGKLWSLYDDEGVRDLSDGPVFGAQTYIVFMRACSK